MHVCMLSFVPLCMCVCWKNPSVHSHSSVTQTAEKIAGMPFLIPSQDTSAGSSSLAYRALQVMKTQLSDPTLHDTWRTLHPKEKDYTLFSPPHNKYSRLDYFFISRNDLTLFTTATIAPMFISDHNPISMTLSFPTSKMLPRQLATYRLCRDAENHHANCTLFSRE